MLLGFVSISTVFAFAPLSQQWGRINILDFVFVFILVTSILFFQAVSIIFVEAIGRTSRNIKIFSSALIIIYLNINIFYLYFVLTNSEKNHFIIIATPLTIALLFSYRYVFLKKLIVSICLFILIQQLISPISASGDRNSSGQKISFSQSSINKPKHSIYFVAFDALVSQKALSELYRADNLPHIKFMNDNDYKVYDILTPGFDTSSTFGSWYSYGSVKSLRSPKRYFNGISSNAFYSDLRNNNFKIQFVSHSDYLGVDVQKIDSFYPEVASIAICDIGNPRYAFGICDYDIFKRVVNLFAKNRLIERGLGNDLGYSYVEDRLRFSNSEQPNKWFSVSYILYPGHADYYSPMDHDAIENYRKQYIKRLPDLSRQMYSLHQKILNNDPNAIVVFIGDHGGYLTGRWVLKDGDEIYNQQLFDLDRKSVLMAVYPSAFCKNDLEKIQHTEKLLKVLINCSV